MTEGQANNPPSLRDLVLITIGSAALATLVTVLVVLPAEFGKDPTGFGRISGLKALSDNSFEGAPPAHFFDVGFRSDVVEIPFAGKGSATGKSELEYKVKMNKGGVVVYSWEAEGADRDEFYFDLHGETPPEPDVRVFEFKQATATASNGALIAPVDGIHGWYWQNRSAKPVTLRLRMSGFYSLVPPGEEGNKAGILPVVTPQ